MSACPNHDLSAKASVDHAQNTMMRRYVSDLTEDVSSVLGPHEVGGVRSQSQHSLALNLLLQRLLVLSL